MKLTPWDTFLFEKLVVTQLVKKFSAFYPTPKVQYLVRKNLLLHLIVRQMNPIHFLRLYFFKIHFSIVFPSIPGGGGSTLQRSWLRHFATSREVAGSSPGVVLRFFNWPNSSSRIVALGSTQPLTEISTRNLPGGLKAAGA
jgi:hypothetical protein